MTTVARRRGFDSRATIGLTPPRSVSRNVRPQDGGAAVHYIGAVHNPRSHEDCRASWRASQRHHMSPGGLGTTNGASDIGYSAGVCPHGIVLAGRGWGVRSAAQGSNDGNDRFLAVQGLIGPGQTPTVEMLEGIAWVVWEWRQLGAGQKVRPHKFFRSTSCPGPLESLAADLHLADIPTSGTTPGTGGGGGTSDWSEELIMSLPYVERGDRGDKVRRVQGLCVAYGGDARQAVESSGGVDGVAGAGTDRAIRAVQQSAPPVDGIVGPVTYHELLGA